MSTLHPHSHAHTIEWGAFEFEEGPIDKWASDAWVAELKLSEQMGALILMHAACVSVRSIGFKGVKMDAHREEAFEMDWLTVCEKGSQILVEGMNAE